MSTCSRQAEAVSRAEVRWAAVRAAVRWAAVRAEVRWAADRAADPWAEVFRAADRLGVDLPAVVLLNS